MPKKSIPKPTAEQVRAWGYYGAPKVNKAGKSSTSLRGDGAISSQVGEVRYVIGWMADQMVRMGWRVTFSGSEAWSVTLPNDQGTVTSDPEETDMESERHPTNASLRLLEEIDWNSRTVREVTTNLFVAGELNYALVKDVWRVISVIRSDREDLLSSATINVRGIWPHPADPEAPDAPLFGVLGVLDDMVWLNRLSRSQSANRVGMRGLLGVADTFKTANGATGEAFWADLEASLSKPMSDPEDVSPVGLIGSQELVEPKEGGMKGLSWVIPDFPYDDKVDERMEKLVQRLAYGLPVPPEIVLGLQAQSKATAFQVEGQTYRAHIEPVALLVSKVATDVLKLFLSDEESVSVQPDPTSILARRHSVADVVDAFDRGAANFDYLREVLGIPKRAEMSPEDIELWHQLKAGRSERLTSAEDPAETAAKEPISAAVRMPASSQIDQETATTEADEYLAEVLHRIDMMALHELIGAADQAVAKARERIGGFIRSNAKLKSRIPNGVRNEDVITELGPECLEALGSKGDDLIESAIASTLTWWTKRLAKAQSQATLLLSDAGVEAQFSPKAAIESVEALRIVLTDAVPNSGTVQETRLRTVLELAGKQP